METLSFAENRREKFRKLLSEEIKWTENEKELKISDIKEAVTIVQTMWSITILKKIYFKRKYDPNGFDWQESI